MKIGIDGRELIKDGMTGIGRYLRNFLEFALKERPDHTFIVYGNQNTWVDFVSPNLKVKIIPERFTIFWDHIILSRYIYRDKVDVFFSPFDKAPIFSPVPFIITIHDLLFYVISERNYLTRDFYNTAYTLLRKTIAKRASLVITVSQYSKNDIVKRWEILEDKVKVIPNGISEQFKPIESLELIDGVKKRYGIKGNYLLYVGNFKPHKNVTCLIDAFAKLPQDLKNLYQLVLCGKKDKYRILLEREIGNLRLSGKVVFIDMIAEEDLPALYSGATIFVFPSLYEGFGLPPLEAMACGTPVVCSNATSLPEVVGDSGVLVDPERPEALANAIESLLSDRSLLESLSLKGLKRAKEFSLEHTAKKLLETIEGIVKV